MKTIRMVGLGVVGALALALAPGAPAQANVAAQPADLVGVGSDTAMYAANFGFDGDVNGNPGFNNVNSSRRGMSFDPTGDANGRTTTVVGSPNSVTAVLRAGQKPVVLPNGSGSGINALLADTGATEVINFTRSSRLPTATEQNTAVTNGWGGLHVYQFADDRLKVAVSNVVPTHAPAALSITDLVHVYDGSYATWGQVPGYAGSAPGSAIHPVFPQLASGTASFFKAQLKAANGGVDVVLASTVVFAEEHDPNLIKSDADAVAPFSVPRITMLNGGYFGAANQNLVLTLDGTGTFDVTRGLYFIVRQRDVADHTGPISVSGITYPWQAGGTKNWVETLFSGSTSYFARSSNKASIESSGVTWHYSDLGLASA